MNAYESQITKQHTNNPLKDISNYSNCLKDVKFSSRQSIPFDIAPSQAKINNFFDLSNSTFKGKERYSQQEAPNNQANSFH